MNECNKYCVDWNSPGNTFAVGHAGQNRRQVGLMALQVVGTRGICMLEYLNGLFLAWIRRALIVHKPRSSSSNGTAKATLEKQTSVLFYTIIMLLSQNLRTAEAQGKGKINKTQDSELFSIGITIKQEHVVQESSWSACQVCSMAASKGMP